jgi:hypothetical protein
MTALQKQLFTEASSLPPAAVFSPPEFAAWAAASEPVQAS